MGKGRIDWFLFAIAAGLTLFGSAMVYSASAMISMRETQSATQYSYFYKQFGFTLLGLVVMFVASRIDYRRFQDPRVIYGILGVTLLALLSVFVFPEINGARRWIRFGGLSFQPSELAKIALPLFLAYFYTKNENSIGEFKATVLPSLLVLGLIAGLIFVEPDLGTTIVLCAIFASVYFAAGARILHLLPVAGMLIMLGLGALIFAPWRLRRLAAFFDPCDPENAAGAGYQVCQSLYAIGSGGILGEGFGKGEQKLFYLPYPYSDFIFSVVGEELGLIGTLAVVIAFGLFLWRGTRAALMAEDRFGMLLGFGIVTGIVVQALFNISVVISILPAKGIPLPFISYGGSSVMITLFAVGILLNISQNTGKQRSATAEKGRDTVYRRKGKAGVR
ncbi:MAG: putative lipid II flippase FtsW [Acidobacteriota bacterium]